MRLRSLMISVVVLVSTGNIYSQCCCFRKIENPLVSLVEDEDPLIRKCSAVLLGERKERKGIAVLIKALKDRDEFVRGWSLWALGRIKDEECLKSIFPLVNDENEFVRGMAVWALGRLWEKAGETERKEVFEILKKKLCDSHPLVQWWSAVSLEIMGQENLVEEFLMCKKVDLSALKENYRGILQDLKWEDIPKLALLWMRFGEEEMKGEFLKTDNILLKDIVESF